tara:strand:- start:485 stop:757 length:273 start_codon:yes stop_codon:yes gene_type:complete
MDTLVAGDIDMPCHLLPADELINNFNRRAYRELANFIAEDPANPSKSLNLMAVSKSLEGIPCHAKNIAEKEVFVYKGPDIRHGGLENETI